MMVAMVVLMMMAIWEVLVVVAEVMVMVAVMVLMPDFKTSKKQGKGSADLMMPFGNWFIIVFDPMHKNCLQRMQIFMKPFCSLVHSAASFLFT